MCAIEGASVADFHYSRPVHSLPTAYVFTKRRRPVIDRLYDSIGWLNSFYILKYYNDKFESGEEN